MHGPRYPFTPDERANALLAADGTALLIGLCLEQQVRSEKAMSGPDVLRQRLGRLDARTIAAMPDAKIEAVFRKPPAIHRFPAMMARRVKALCKIIAAEYGGKGVRLWERARSAAVVYDRLRSLPGFGDAKAASGVRILGKFGGYPLEGWKRYSTDEELPWVFAAGTRVL